jgi:hypothetical protein
MGAIGNLETHELFDRDQQSAIVAAAEKGAHTPPN